MIVAQSGFFYSRKSENQRSRQIDGTLKLQRQVQIEPPFKVVNDELIGRIERSAVTLYTVLRISVSSSPVSQLVMSFRKLVQRNEK